jgi:hypothetical protein
MKNSSLKGFNIINQEPIVSDKGSRSDVYGHANSYSLADGVHDARGIAFWMLWR